VITDLPQISDNIQNQYKVALLPWSSSLSSIVNT